MKTASEIYNLPNCPSVNIIEAMNFALAEHDAEIIKIIDEMIEDARHDTDVDVGMSRYAALTELKERIK